MEKKRIEFIDLAKGVCIIWVILWHANILDMNIPGLNSVRMPLYFVLSGLFFKTYGSLYNHVIKKVNKILIPFLFFYLTGYVIFYAVDYIFPGAIKTEANGILDLFTQRQYFNGPIWFLLCLFWTNIMFCVIQLNVRSEIRKGAIVILLSAVGVILGQNRIFLPMTLDSSLTALLFFWIGYTLKRTPILYPNRFDKYNVLIGAAFYLIALGIDVLFSNPRFGMSINKVHGNPVLAYAVSLASVFAILFVCKAIRYLPFVSYFGRYSIIPLCIHRLTYKPVKAILVHCPDYITEYQDIIITIAPIVICYFLIPVCKKYLPYVTAQKDLIKTKRQTLSTTI